MPLGAPALLVGSISGPMQRCQAGPGAGCAQRLAWAKKSAEREAELLGFCRPLANVSHGPLKAARMPHRITVQEPTTECGTTPGPQRTTEYQRTTH